MRTEDPCAQHLPLVVIFLVLLPDEHSVCAETERCAVKTPNQAAVAGNLISQDHNFARLLRGFCLLESV